MTPNDIDILLHYYCSNTEHERIEAPAVRESIQDFLREGILRQREPEERSLYGATYTTTDRGQMLIRALCSVPYPEQRWVMPEPYPTPTDE